MDTHGFGMSSVRFICGTKIFTKHRKIAGFMEEDTLLRF
jgi:hypothetical protein